MALVSLKLALIGPVLGVERLSEVLVQLEGGETLSCPGDLLAVPEITELVLPLKDALRNSRIDTAVELIQQLGILPVLF